MSKIAVVLIAFSFILTSCSVWSLMWGENEIIAKTNANYVDYSAETVKNTEGDKVLFFHASWCGPCKSTSKKLSEIETSTGITVFKIDYDNSAELRKKYDVTSQHTFVQIDWEWNMLAKWSGSKDLEDIKWNLVESKMMNDKESEGMKDGHMDDSKMTDEKIMADDKEEMNKDMMDDKESEIMADDKDEMKKDMMDDEKSEIITKEAWKYVEYSADEVAATSGNKVLFFHATWCPNCKASDEAFNSEATPNGLSIFKVDYDTNTDLRKKYGVITQTTFVQIDDNGTMVKRWFGSRNYQEILNELQ